MSKLLGKALVQHPLLHGDRLVLPLVRLLHLDELALVLRARLAHGVTHRAQLCLLLSRGQLRRLEPARRLLLRVAQREHALDVCVQHAPRDRERHVLDLLRELLAARLAVGVAPRVLHGGEAAERLAQLADCAILELELRRQVLQPLIELAQLGARSRVEHLAAARVAERLEVRDAFLRLASLEKKLLQPAVHATGGARACALRAACLDLRVELYQMRGEAVDRVPKGERAAKLAQLQPFARGEHSFSLGEDCLTPRQLNSKRLRRLLPRHQRLLGRLYRREFRRRLTRLRLLPWPAARAATARAAASRAALWCACGRPACACCRRLILPCCRRAGRRPARMAGGRAVGRPPASAARRALLLLRALELRLCGGHLLTLPLQLDLLPSVRLLERAHAPCRLLRLAAQRRELPRTLR